MSKDIKDYLHLYLGCEAVVVSSNGRGGLVNYTDILKHEVFVDYQSKHSYIKQLKPILRPLSDMTAQERLQWFREYRTIPKVNEYYEPEELIWLLSKGFDLFDLIESGLAIDKTKLSC